MECTRIYSIHDQAITFEFAEIISEEINIHIISLKNAIEEHPFNGFIECVPAYSSLTVYFHSNMDKNEVIKIVNSYNSKLNAHNSTSNNKIITIPVCYEMGEDLSIVTSQLNLSEEEVIRLHSEQSYRVFMIGFTPGFPYMGTLPKVLEMERKKTPSLNIQSGSVAIAGKQTGIYPINSPGGWHVIGRTPVNMFDKKRTPACFLQAGDIVQFKPITKREFEQYP